MLDHIPASWSVMARIVFLDQCHWITMARARVARHVGVHVNVQDRVRMNVQGS